MSSPEQALPQPPNGVHAEMVMDAAPAANDSGVLLTEVALAEAAELKRRSQELDAEMARLKAKLAEKKETTPPAKAGSRSRLANRVARRRSAAESQRRSEELHDA